MSPIAVAFPRPHYGRPRDRVHAIQIELARRLYMDEQALTKKPREFDNLKKFLSDGHGGPGRAHVSLSCV